MKYIVYLECDEETLKEGGYLAQIREIAERYRREEEYVKHET